MMMTDLFRKIRKHVGTTTLVLTLGLSGAAVAGDQIELITGKPTPQLEMAINESVGTTVDVAFVLVVDYVGNVYALYDGVTETYPENPAERARRNTLPTGPVVVKNLFAATFLFYENAFCVSYVDTLGNWKQKCK